MELLEKRGSNYADRPRFVMFEELVFPNYYTQPGLTHADCLFPYT